MANERKSGKNINLTLNRFQTIELDALSEKYDTPVTKLIGRAIDEFIEERAIPNIIIHDKQYVEFIPGSLKVESLNLSDLADKKPTTNPKGNPSELQSLSNRDDDWNITESQEGAVNPPPPEANPEASVVATELPTEEFPNTKPTSSGS